MAKDSHLWDLLPLRSTEVLLFRDWEPAAEMESKS